MGPWNKASRDPYWDTHTHDLNPVVPASPGNLFAAINQIAPALILWMKILRSRAGGRYLGKMVERGGRSGCLRAARQGTPWM